MKTKIEGPAHKWDPDFQEGIVIGRIRNTHVIKDFLDKQIEHFNAGLTDPNTVLDKLDNFLEGLLKR